MCCASSSFKLRNSVISTEFPGFNQSCMILLALRKQNLTQCVARMCQTYIHELNRIQSINVNLCYIFT